MGLNEMDLEELYAKVPWNLVDSEPFMSVPSSGRETRTRCDSMKDPKRDRAKTHLKPDLTPRRIPEERAIWSPQSLNTTSEHLGPEIRSKQPQW